MRNHLLPFFVLVLLGAASTAPPPATVPHAPTSTTPADVDAALKAGRTALGLIEVTDVHEQDSRAMDNILADIVSFRIVKSTGRMPPDIRIIKAFGNLPSFPRNARIPESILLPNPLVAGQRYWVIFNSTDVVAWWPEKTAPTATLDVVVAAAPASTPWDTDPPAKPADPAEPAARAILDRASALCLVEVTSVERTDSRGRDGALDDKVNFKILQASGESPYNVFITLDYSSMTGVRYVPHGSLYPNPLRKGRQYWLAMASKFERSGYPDGVLAWWPKDAAPTKLLEEAVRADRFATHPQFDPVTGRTLAVNFDSKKNATTVTVQKNGQLLWEKSLDGRDWSFALTPRLESEAKDAPANESGLFVKIELSDIPFQNALDIRASTARLYLDFDTGKLVLPPIPNPTR